MKALNLNRLNLHAPYSVWLVSKDNYGFRYFIKVSSIIAEGQVNYVAIIVQKDNEHLDTIIRDFDHFVGFFADKPSSNS